MQRFLTLLILTLALHAPQDVRASEGAEGGTGPFYYDLSPALVTNLASGGKYLRCDVQLMSEEGDSMPGIKLHAPAIRHELLMLMSEQDGAKLRTQQGREAFRKQALEAVRKVMHQETGRDAVDDLFFTAFFVQ
jgi:flagellar protein FliL